MAEQIGNITPVVLGRIDNGELWFLVQMHDGLAKHRKVTTMIDGEIIEDEIVEAKEVVS